MLPHLEAAYNLALWIMRHPQDAEDVVQISYLKAYKAFHQFSGNNDRAWMLKIVRNNCMTNLKRNKRDNVIRLDVNSLVLEAVTYEQYLSQGAGQPEIDAELKSQRESVHNALSQLPFDYREVIVLREFEDLGYQQIADIIDVPIGTVMSRLSRARKKLAQIMKSKITQDLKREL